MDIQLDEYPWVKMYTLKMLRNKCLSFYYPLLVCHNEAGDWLGFLIKLNCRL